MKNKYLFIPEDGRLTPQTKFYIVWVGISQNEAQGLQELAVIALQEGFYLHKWDLDTAVFLRRIALSLSTYLALLPIVSIGILKLMRYYRAYKDYPDVPPIMPHERQFRDFLLPEERTNRLISVIREAEAKQRNKPKPRHSKIVSLLE